MRRLCVFVCVCVCVHDSEASAGLWGSFREKVIMPETISLLQCLY